MSERSRLRLLVLQVLVLSLLVTLFARLWYLQVVTGDRYEAAATENRIREVSVPALRGSILDDRGRPLVRNRSALVVTVDRGVLSRRADGGERVLRRLGDLLGEPYADLRDRTQLCGTAGAEPPPVCWNGSPYQPIPVADRVAPRVALQVLERHEEFPGVNAEAQAVRDLPFAAGAQAAHVLGYLSPVTEQELARQLREDGTGRDQLAATDLVGRSGLERSYDEDLRGVPGVRQVAVDRLGRVTGVVSETAPVPGNHLVTSIDAELQAVAERQLRAAIARARSTFDDNTNRKYRADSGAAIVLDVTNGRVIAMASYPSYDPRVWIDGVSQNELDRLYSEEAGIPLLSRATQGEFAPASTFKVISTAAAAMSGFPLEGPYDCSSSFTVGDRRFDNYDSVAFGPIDLSKALQVSCDTVFYRIGYQMWLRDGGTTAVSDPKEPMVRMAQAFGLGEPTGIDLPGEADGRIADREWKLAYYEQMKGYYCRLAKKNPKSQEFLDLFAREFCAEGYVYRAGDAVNFSIGQGDTTVTPLQMATVYAAIANGGTLWAPRVGKAVVSPDGEVVRRIEPQRRGRVPVSPRVLDYIRDALVETTRYGTGAIPFDGFPLDEIPVGTKTGTGEVYGKQTTSWFASIDERYAVVMMVGQGGTGSETSGPSVRKIWEALYGVRGSKVVPEAAILPGGRPPRGLPDVTDLPAAVSR